MSSGFEGGGRVTWKIVKKGYSRSPWRLVTECGQEIETVCSKTGIVMSVCGQTRSEVEAWLLDRIEWYARCANAGVLPPVYSPNWRTTAKIDSTATVATQQRKEPGA